MVGVLKVDARRVADRENSVRFDDAWCGTCLARLADHAATLLTVATARRETTADAAWGYVRDGFRRGLTVANLPHDDAESLRHCCRLAARCARQPAIEGPPQRHCAPGTSRRPDEERVVADRWDAEAEVAVGNMILDYIEDNEAPAGSAIAAELEDWGDRMERDGRRRLIDLDGGDA